MTPAEVCWNSRRNWMSLVSLWRMWLERVSYCSSCLLVSPHCCFAAYLWVHLWRFTSGCLQGNLGRSIVDPCDSQEKSVLWLPSRLWSQHIQTHSGGTFYVRQQLWGSSITRTLCAWRELSPKVSQNVWERVLGWEQKLAHFSGLREFAVREAVLWEDRHCHVREWGKEERYGFPTESSSSVRRGLSGPVSRWEVWIGRDASGLYVQYKEECKIIGRCVRRRAASCGNGVGVLAGVGHCSLCWGIWIALKGMSRRIWKRLKPSCLPQGRPMMIITEYMENGALDTFLRVRKSNLS